VPRAAKVIWKDPAIRLVAHVATITECRGLRRLASSRLHRARVSHESGPKVSRGRKAETAWFHAGKHRLVDSVSSRIARLVGVPLVRAEALQIARYRIGGEYRSHFDSYDPNSKRGRHFLRERGQRTWTGLLYLCNVAAGGETAFPRLGIEIPPARGNLLIFQNCFQGSRRVHPLSLHEARPVLRGVKWTATLWFRDRPNR
jgi:prolyl 4-hydroxylase